MSFLGTLLEGSITKPDRHFDISVETPQPEHELSHKLLKIPFSLVAYLFHIVSSLKCIASYHNTSFNTCIKLINFPISSLSSQKILECLPSRSKNNTSLPIKMVFYPLGNTRRHKMSFPQLLMLSTICFRTRLVCSGNLHKNEEKHFASSCFFLLVRFRVAPRPQSC